jgi:hypothetical protein
MRAIRLAHLIVIISTTFVAVMNGDKGFENTVKLELSGLIRTVGHPDMQKIRVIGFFFENRLQWQFEGETISTNGCFRLHIYLRTNKIIIHNSLWGPLMVAQWLRYCAANRKVAGSIPDGVIGIFH